MSISKLKVTAIASAFSITSLSLFSQAGFAQNAIAPDTTLPINTSVNFNSANKTYTITGGTEVGINQFHSFRDFSVPTSNTAHFDTAPTTVNAISRVTGSNISNIDGLIKANGTTNLYLINPNGIVFGKDAKLEIGGSFGASTANSFKFTDGSEFSATNPQSPPLLKVNVPIGLQMGRNSGSIQLLGTSDGFYVKPQQSLFLLAGSILSDGAKIVSPESNIQLGALKESGLVTLSDDLRFMFPDGVERGDITIKNRALFQTVGRGGDQISIFSRNFLLQDASSLRTGIGEGKEETLFSRGIDINASERADIKDNSFLDGTTFGIGNAALIKVTAKSITLAGTDSNAPPYFPYDTPTRGAWSHVVSEVAPDAKGRGGDIAFKSDSLLIGDGAVISSSTLGNGNAGHIKIETKDTTTLQGVDKDGGFVSINSVAAPGARGSAGDVKIATGSFLAKDGAQIIVSTFANGDAGKIEIKAKDSITLQGEGLEGLVSTGFTSQVRRQVVPGGEENIRNSRGIRIETSSLYLLDGAAISTAVFSRNNASVVDPGELGLPSLGNSGLIDITASKEILLKGENSGRQVDGFFGSRIVNQIRSNGVGNAAPIRITTPILSLSGKATIFSNSAGIGNAGSIIINAADSVNLAQDTTISVETSSVGAAGNIEISTSHLIIRENASITATATATATNTDGGGSINLNASNFDLFGTVGVFAETESSANAGTLKLSPYGADSDLKINLTTGSKISASTSSVGNGGNIELSAPESITLTGSGEISVTTSDTGNAGNISFNAPSILLTNGVLVSASTLGTGKGGDIRLGISDTTKNTVNNVTLSNGAKIDTSTSSSGDSGKIEIIAGNSLILDGNNTGIFATTLENSTGNGGSIFIDPPLVSITNGAGISVDSLGQGNGGDLTVFAGKLVFANNAFLKANTASGEGGNINLQIADIFFPRHNSSINATAGGTGNGGNINLSAMFAIAIPSENNDIFANASFGMGGNINLTTRGLFGLEFRSRLTPLSDITASSDFGVNGTVNINTPGIDPSKGLSNLPANIRDASTLVTQRCLADRQSSAFVITGRGGIPVSPADVISGNNLQENLGTPSSNRLASQSSQLVSQSPNPQTNRIIEAQGWTINQQGQVSLVADFTQAIPANTWVRQLQCR